MISAKEIPIRTDVGLNIIVYSCEEKKGRRGGGEEKDSVAGFP